MRKALVMGWLLLLVVGIGPTLAGSLRPRETPGPGVKVGQTSGRVNGDFVEPVSERELEVLRLLAEGRSNREISRELVIAISTVKTHVHNLYGKLNVRRRGEAVARARELNLV